MKTKDLINRYFRENFFIIPLHKNSKVPLEKKWNERPLTETEALNFIWNGFNIGIVGGDQSKGLVILDFDGRLHEGRISENINRWRSLDTCIQFSPKGFHVFLRTNTDNEIVLMQKIEDFIKDHNLPNAHRTTLNPKHEENTFDKKMSKKEHDSYFDSFRFTSMYVVASPSKVLGKSYWWLDDMKGDILII